MNCTRIYVVFDNTYCPVHWLRIALANVKYGPKQSRLVRINEKFSVTIKPFILSEEIKTLYALYKSAVDFDAPDSVEFWLLNGAKYSVFDTYVIEIRDDDKLIAVGIFDNGEQSIAGIMNFYHPDYRKQSLGKYLMMLKINYAQLQQKEYYYPGYLVSNYPKFNYKLFSCEAATEVFNENSGQWLPFSWEIVNVIASNMLGEH